MADELRIDASRFNTATAALADIARLDGGAILREEARQFLRRAMIKAPPFKVKREDGTSSESDLSVGRKAVSGDLKRAMRPITPEQMTRNKRMAEIVRTGNKEAWNAVASKLRSGPLAKTTAIDFSVSAHTSQRNRYGRVLRDRRKVVFGVDKWTEYRNILWTRVGILKSGWNAAMLNPALQHGDKDSIKVPNYVKRHGVKFSTATVIMTGEKPSIDMTNKGVKWPRYEAMINDTFRVRENAIKTKMRRILQGKATNLGFSHTLGG